VARDGGVFAFGDAAYRGSLPAKGIKTTVAAIAPSYDNAGYYVLADNGKVFAFGNASSSGSFEPEGTGLPGVATAIVSRHPQA
jgi:hypothetical protein